MENFPQALTNKANSRGASLDHRAKGQRILHARRKKPSVVWTGPSKGSEKKSKKKALKYWKEGSSSWVRRKVRNKEVAGSCGKRAFKRGAGTLGGERQT